MARLKQSIAWWCYVRGDFTPEKLLRAAVDIGYEAVELVPQQHWQAVIDAGLVIASHGAHVSIPDGLNARENRERITSEIRESLALATQWRIPNLICFSGNRRDGLSDVEGAEITAENLRHVAKMAEDAGVTLVLEVLNSKVDHVGYQADKSAWAVQVCRWVDSPRVRVLYDIYHMQIMEGDIIRSIRENHAYYAHYHTAGNPGRHELDDEQEINYPPIMRAIAETDYQGYVGQEFIPKGDPVAALKAAFETCSVNNHER
jgi:hydroxypyruvate isomerase